MNQESASLKPITNRHEQRFIVFIGLSFAAMLLSAFMLTLFGIIDLRLAAQVSLPPAIEFGINSLLFLTNIYFMISIILGIFDKRIIKIVSVYIPIYLICCLFPNAGLIATSIIPFTYVIIVNDIFKILKRSALFKNIFVFIIIVSKYQQLSAYIKIQIYGLKYIEINSISALIFAIDMYMFFILYYMVVRKHVEFDFIHSKGERIFQVPERIQDEVDLSELKAHQRFIFWVLATGYQVFQLIVVLCIGLINNAFVEILVMLAVFWIGRPILGNSWHSDTLMICSAVTFCGFYILTKCTLPISVSMFSCIVLSGLFVYILYRAGIYEDEYNALKAYKKERETFNPKTCTLDQMLERCRLANIAEDDTDLLIWLYIDKIKPKALAFSDKCYLSEQTIRNKKSLLTKRIKSIN